MFASVFLIVLLTRREARQKKEKRSLVESPLKNATLQKCVKEQFGHELKKQLLDVKTRCNFTMIMVEKIHKTAKC